MLLPRWSSPPVEEEARDLDDKHSKLRRQGALWLVARRCRLRLPSSCGRALLVVALLVLAAFAISGLWRGMVLEAELRRGQREFARLSSVSPSGSVVPILIPVYSRPSYLQRTVNSLRANANIQEVRVSRPPGARASPLHQSPLTASPRSPCARGRC